MLEVPEVSLAVALEDLGYGAAGFLHDGAVEVHEFPAQGAGQDTADGGLPAPHVTDYGHEPFQTLQGRFPVLFMRST